ncbi:Hypothetical protein NTJ_14670 [Nesidiocoris tenuis]|uniref:Uncharacterized protein n=1 Tax=Nesidiocoris tenuis TaxID=355587 RepID=A0ABN7BFH3_9HEMI|nr:Hypothetical protein NTJ_14670 [Nesidiocoris tenuis]
MAEGPGIEETCPCGRRHCSPIGQHAPNYSRADHTGVPLRDRTPQRRKTTVQQDRACETCDDDAGTSLRHLRCILRLEHHSSRCFIYSRILPDVASQVTDQPPVYSPTT